MNAQEAEASYRSLKSQLDSGRIQLDEYNQKIAELRYQDNANTWWAINGADGSWLKWTGNTWEPAFAQQVPAAQQSTSQANIPPMVTPTPLAKQKKKRNWIGIGSLIFGLLSWVLFPIILGLLAVIIGIVAVWSAKKAGSKIPVSAIVGIIIGLLAIVLNYFWFAIFPPPTVLPPIK